jgi:hypothetical protein
MMIFWKQDTNVLSGSSWLGLYRMENFCENSNETSGSVQHRAAKQLHTDFEKCSVIYTLTEYDYLLGNDSVHTA